MYFYNPAGINLIIPPFLLFVKVKASGQYLQSGLTILDQYWIKNINNILIISALSMPKENMLQK